MYVLAGSPVLARRYVGVHRSIWLMSSSLLLQQCPACLFRLTWIVAWWVAGGRIIGALLGVAARTCLILLTTFSCNCHLASSPAVSSASKQCIHAAVSTRQRLGRNCVSFYRLGLVSIWPILYRYLSMSFSVDETLLPKYVNLSTSFREVPSSVEMWPAWLKHIYSVFCALTWRPMPAAALKVMTIFPR